MMIIIVVIVQHMQEKMDGSIFSGWNYSSTSWQPASPYLCVVIIICNLIMVTMVMVMPIITVVIGDGWSPMLLLSGLTFTYGNKNINSFQMSIGDKFKWN